MREVLNIWLRIDKNQAWDGEQRDLGFMSVMLSLTKSKKSSSFQRAGFYDRMLWRRGYGDLSKGRGVRESLS